MTQAPPPAPPPAEPVEGLALAADFPARSHDDWRGLAAKIVNRSRPEGKHLDPEGAEASLRTNLPGGIEIEPLYLRRESSRPLGVPGAMPFTRGRALRERETPWDVRQLHDDPDAGTTGEAVLADLEHGVTSVWLHVGDDGLAAADVSRALDGVLLDLAPVVVSSWSDQAGAAAALLDVLRGADSAAVAGSLGHDPIGAAARTGSAPDLGALADAAHAVAGMPQVGAITVDTRPYHDAGCTAVDEIAFAVATGVAYLRHLEAEGVDVAEAFATIDFRVAVTADQFLAAATLRALRRVWARVGEASGVPEDRRGARTHAVTSLRMFTRDDPYVNILRSTLATFGATLGGADAVTVLPFDTVHGLPTPFSRRVARNTQILLAAESNVGMVTDPAGGSWYVEDLTDDLARAAWTAFQEVERAGGMAEALTTGEIRARIDAGVDDRGTAIATRRQPITGVSMFPQLDEHALERQARALLATDEGALAPHRDAEVWEGLRDRAAALGGATVVVAALGARRDFGARETFVANLLAAGGIATRTVEGGVDDVVAAAAESRSPFVVIASSPKGYAAHAAEAISGLRGAGVERILIAGRAAELGDAADTVDGEIRDGMDVVALLDDTLGRFDSPGGATKGAQA